MRNWFSVVVKNDALAVPCSGSSEVAEPEGGFAVVSPFRNSVVANV